MDVKEREAKSPYFSEPQEDIVLDDAPLETTHGYVIEDLKSHSSETQYPPPCYSTSSESLILAL